MARYHVIHRGNQRREVFFCDRDRQLDLGLVLEVEAEAMEQLRPVTNTCRPCGGDSFIESIESRNIKWNCLNEIK